MKVDLVWLANPKDWESDWLHDLWKSANITVNSLETPPGEHLAVTSPAVFVCSNKFPYRAVLAQQEKAQIPFGVFHLSDEYSGRQYRFL